MIGRRIAAIVAFSPLSAAPFGPKRCKVGHSAIRDRFARSAVARAETGEHMADRDDEAQKQYAKLQRSDGGKKPVAGYEAEAIALRAKTERLRALRLARDAELAANAPPAPAKKARAAKPAKAAKGTSGAPETKANLSDWLDAREGSGHKN
jgi:hypothetical protein